MKWLWNRFRPAFAQGSTLAEYAWLVERIRKNRKSMNIEVAVEKAIDEMPKTYGIRPFLIGNRAEVKDMCITEYNEAETMKMFKEEGREEGEERLAVLNRKLLRDKRYDILERISEDKAYRQKLYEEYHIV